MKTTDNELKKREVLRLSNEESNRITRECLQTALILLMSEKPFEKITVTELVKRSGVSRTAFYRNYNTKEDILLEIASGLYDTISKSLSVPKYSNNPKLWFLDFFTECQKSSQLLRFLIETNQLALSNINYMVLDTLFSTSQPKARYSSLAAEGALYFIFKEWITAGTKETPEEMADICVEIFRL